MEKTIKILGTLPLGAILCHSEKNVAKQYRVIIEPITEKEETAIDKAERYYGEIRYVRKDGIIIPSAHIYLYGEVDFDSEEDLNILERFHLINDSNYDCNWVYSNIDYDAGTCTTIDGRLKGYPTWNPIKWFKFNHLLIGKPKRVIVYKYYGKR